MYSSLRIAVAKLSRSTRNNQSHDDYDFHESVVLRRYCLLLLRVDFVETNATE